MKPARNINIKLTVNTKLQPINIPGLTDEQNAWLNHYQGATMFEPMGLDELQAGTKIFNEVAQENIDWYERHMYDTFSSISSHVPYDDEETARKKAGAAADNLIDPLLASTKNLIRLFKKD